MNNSNENSNFGLFSLPPSIFMSSDNSKNMGSFNNLENKAEIQALNQKVEQLKYVNQMLQNNISVLTQINYSNMLNHNNMVKHIKNLEKMVEKKRKHDEISDLLTPEASESEDYPINKLLKTENKSLKKTENKYSLKTYIEHSESWSDDKINDFFKNLTSLKDILNLKSEWNNIKHNEKLQKLHNVSFGVEKLEEMIGLEEVKKEIFKIIIYYIQNSHTDEYLHTVITGPPGVGKTEIAKIYADIFVRLGVLKSDKFIEIKRDDLVARYLGHTSIKTKELLEKAMGGVIFLDEAYSLGNEDKRDTYAKEAIDMINQYLSERKKDFMFVIAGYEEDLEKCFFSLNKGLKRRFSHWIKIPKYSKDELKMIFQSKIKRFGYELDNTLDSKQLTNFFEKHYYKFENYGGDIEKFINYIKYEQSFRTFRENTQNKIICLNDMNISIKKFGNKSSNQLTSLYV